MEHDISERRYAFGEIADVGEAIFSPAVESQSLELEVTLAKFNSVFGIDFFEDFETSGFLRHPFQREVDHIALVREHNAAQVTPLTALHFSASQCLLHVYLSLSAPHYLLPVNAVLPRLELKLPN